ncbi:MAG: translesion error-prone DNA polymerase V autoproteolytic subunit [Candidatus Omnitrophica bacterium]|nr:translesion error-prone DNA polymerase V autoproteolytic subunit [Candidatus Omnitrophota bacterium]
MILGIQKYTTKIERKLPLYLSHVPAGFPSPADDYIEKSLDLNEYLIDHPASTFFVRVKGDSMINAGIQNGSILIVDRSLEAINNKIVVAILNGEFTVKRMKKYNGNIFLVAENPNYAPIEVTSNMDFEVWGVVVHVIHSV